MNLQVSDCGEAPPPSKANSSQRESNAWATVKQLTFPLTIMEKKITTKQNRHPHRARQILTSGRAMGNSQAINVPVNKTKTEKKNRHKTKKQQPNKPGYQATSKYTNGSKSYKSYQIWRGSIIMFVSITFPLRCLQNRSSLRKLVPQFENCGWKNQIAVASFHVTSFLLMVTSFQKIGTSLHK